MCHNGTPVERELARAGGGECTFQSRMKIDVVGTDADGGCSSSCMRFSTSLARETAFSVAPDSSTVYSCCSTRCEGLLLRCDW